MKAGLISAVKAVLVTSLVEITIRTATGIIVMMLAALLSNMCCFLQQLHGSFRRLGVPYYKRDPAI